MAPDNPSSLESGLWSDILCSESVPTNDTSNRVVARLRGDERNHPGGPGPDPGPGIGVPHYPDYEDVTHTTTPSTSETENMFALLHRFEANPLALKDVLASNAIHRGTHPSPLISPSIQEVAPKSHLKDTHHLPPYNGWDEPPPYHFTSPANGSHSPTTVDHGPKNSIPPNTALDYNSEGYFRRRYDEGYKRGVAMRKNAKEIGLQTSNDWILGVLKVWYMLTGGYTPLVDNQDLDSDILDTPSPLLTSF
ncbi:hypothetical protein CALCODRAFT_479672 [Calocera cornea HHB12733]|uniref:Uncharacterized protein n=1 Tax=Calocera cornea HHB12733 TaxID=1353952 RepID=A0A165JBM3_9BASI|nr:hypothetical protein CALCODRAFT_479672 [Calocera cornea HHB12733]